MIKARVLFWAGSILKPTMDLSEFLSGEACKRPFCVVLGHPVVHSLSPLMHNTALQHLGLDVRYHAVDTPGNSMALVDKLLHLKHFKGANVTIPLKSAILGHVHVQDYSVRNTGAANTLVPSDNDASNRVITAYNTDIAGFLKPLEQEPLPETAVVLGTGGASLAIRYALRNAGVKELIVISRRPTEYTGTIHPTETITTYGYLEQALNRCNLLVNTTPVGMFPRVDQSPIPASCYRLLEGKRVYDIVYNPLQTELLRCAAEHGARITAGLEMFIEQAGLSFERWFGVSMPREPVYKVLQKALTTT